MSDWKSCENCEDQHCYSLMKMEGLPVESACLDWKPLRCRCGGEAVYYDDRWHGCCGIQCTKCGIDMSNCESEEEAIRKWNTVMK